MLGNRSANAQSLIAESPQASASKQANWKAKRYAVKFNPPSIFLEYEDSDNNVRVRAVKLTSIQPGVDVDRLTRKVILSFPRKLDAASVKYDQVRNLVIKLIEHAAGNVTMDDSHTSAAASRRSASGAFPPRPSPLSLSSDLTDAPGTSPRRPGQPLGAISTSAATSLVTSPVSATASPRLASPRLASPRLTSRDELAGLRRASDTGALEFANVAAGSEDDAEDDLDAALDELDRELVGPFQARSASSSSRRSSMTGLQPMKPTASLPDMCPAHGTPLQPLLQHKSLGGSLDTVPSTKTRFAAASECLELELSISGDLDLNKVTEVELRMAKARMEEDFEKNRLKPGDPHFQYDKQVEFGPPKEKNEWDDSD